MQFSIGAVYIISDLHTRTHTQSTSLMRLQQRATTATDEVQKYALRNVYSYLFFVFGFFQFSCKACSAAAAASDKTSCCVRACACVLGTTTSQDVIFSITGGVYSGVSPSNTHDDSRYARLCSTRHCCCCYTKNNNQISAKWVWNANWF